MSGTGKKYLVMVDPAAPQQPALDRAIPLALESGAHIEIYACGVAEQIPLGWADKSQVSQLRGLLHQRRLEDLERLARPLRCLGLDVDTFDECDEPIDTAIAHHLREARPDLIIKAAQGSGEIRSWHACTERVLEQHAPCPVFRVEGGSS